MKEDEHTTSNHLSTLSRLVTLKPRISKFGNDDKINNNELRNSNTFHKPSMIKERDFQRTKSKFTNKTTIKEKLYANEKNREEKFDLDQRGLIAYAKKHSSANRPLKKLKESESEEFTDATDTCPCCNLPCIKEGYYEPFKVCDNTDEYSILGQAISLYFSFYKFSIFILIVLFCALILPSFYMCSFYYSSLSNMCNHLLTNNGSNLFSICENYITDKDYLVRNNKESKDSFLSQVNAINILSYIDLYNNIMTNDSIYSNGTYIPQRNEEKGRLMSTLVLDNSLIYLIALITLFIINLLYIIFHNNKILDYNFQIISPSDYTIIMTNMSHIYKSFRRLKFRYMKSNRISSQKEFRAKLGFKDNEITDKTITDAMEFGAFIKKFVINKNENYNIQLVNLCYSLNKFKKLKTKIKEYKNELFLVNYDHRQKKLNRIFRLEGNKRKYFKTPLSNLNFLNLNSSCFEKRIPITKIMRKKKHIEADLNGLLEASKNVNKENFVNVAFISFDTISEQEKFLKKYSQNLLTSLFSNIKNIRYYFCYCFLNKQTKNKWEREIGKESVALAPEPDDVIFKNLDTTRFGRIIRTIITTLVSFVIIVISFIIVILLTLAQEKIDNMSFGAKNFSKNAVSLGMSIAIGIVNAIFQTILKILTDLERHMSLTDYNLSFSIKLTVFTFLNSAIVPLISNVLMNLDDMTINYELLVNNMFMMFLVNSFISPLMWTFDVTYYFKKLLIYMIESKKNPDLFHTMTQKKLNKLYEQMDIELAYKYSYISKTLLMTFFYLPLFPLGVVFSIFGLFFGFYLEKFNIAHRYKRPKMMNEKICRFYANFFEVNFFMLALGNFIFLKNNYKIDYCSIATLILYFILIFVPYGQYLNFNLLGINQSEIINKNYDQAYFQYFYTDYERRNPFTIKIGTINYLKRLKEKDYMTEEEFQKQKKHIEKLSFMQVISQARPSRANWVKKTLGKKSALLNNIGLYEGDKKPRRLFELIKKLYQRPYEDSESYDTQNICSNNIGNNNYYSYKINIPNIIHLVGTIFGTEDENDNTIAKFYLQETDNEINEIKLLKEKKAKRKMEFLGKSIVKEKVRNACPFNIDINKKNIINKEGSNENSNNLINININNQIKIDKSDNKIRNINMNTINTNMNMLTKEEDFSSNKILNEIKSEINKGGKNLMKFTNSSGDNKDNIKEKKENINNMNNFININTTNELNNNNKNNDLTNDVNDDNQNINDKNNINIIDRNNPNENNESNENNDINTNSNLTTQKMPFIPNISVTINQFFERTKNGPKVEANESERIKLENESNDNEKAENKKKYIINQKKKILLKRTEKKEMSNKAPINNIINIVLKNHKINNNDEEEDGIFFNKIINSKMQINENK